MAMAYSDFDLKTALKSFDLIDARDDDLFAAVAPIEISEQLKEWLARFSPVALGINSEMARSTYIITPVLAESMRRAGAPSNVLPGVGFDVDRNLGLSGFCDYLIARSAEYYFVKAPVVAVVEAKKEDLIAGLGQCAAEMVAIRIFNEREQSTIPAVYGCVTSGSLWRFLKLEGSTLSIDRVEYHLSDVAKILGILVGVIRGLD
jgi:hypothetical protein